MQAGHEKPRWEARCLSDGLRHSLFAKTRAEAAERLGTALTGRDRGERGMDSRRTTGAYLEDWLETSVRPRLRPRTVGSYQDVVRRHLDPALGRIPLARLRPVDVTRMLADLDPALSPTTRRYIYSILRIALGRAMKAGTCRATSAR